jgi:hypothetical protein
MLFKEEGIHVTLETRSLDSEGLEVAEEGNGGDLGEELLVQDAAEGEHGKATVLDLLELHGLQVLLAHACTYDISLRLSAMRCIPLSKYPASDRNIAAAYSLLAAAQATGLCATYQGGPT